VRREPRSFATGRVNRAGAAIVFHDAHRPRPADVDGVITKRPIADAGIANCDD
jgi:hypothetical protein